MQGIKAWLRDDPQRGKKLMWENKSYVFFRVLDGIEGDAGPIGAQGVSLTPGRSLAVDPSFHALGLPIFVEAPGLKDETRAPFRRVMIAQDVGSAIRGVERGESFGAAVTGPVRSPARHWRRRISSCSCPIRRRGCEPWVGPGVTRMTMPRCGRRSPRQQHP